MDGLVGDSRWNRNKLDTSRHKAAEGMCLRIRNKIACVQAQLEQAVEVNLEVWEALAEINPMEEKVGKPSYYYRVLLWDKKKHDFSVQADGGIALREIMESNLVLFNFNEYLVGLVGDDGNPIYSNQTTAGEGRYERYFLCGEVLDDELPWDAKMEDW